MTLSSCSYFCFNFLALLHALPFLRDRFDPTPSAEKKRGRYFPVLNEEDLYNHAKMTQIRLKCKRRAAQQQSSSQPTIQNLFTITAPSLFSSSEVNTSANDPVHHEDEDDENENKEAEVEPSLTLTSSSYSTMDEGSQPKSTNSSSSSSSSTTSTLEHSILGARNQKKNKVIKNNTSTFNFNPSSSNTLDSSSSQVINLVSDETNKRPHATSFSSSSNHSNNNNNNNAENNYEMQCLSPTSSRHSQTKARSALSPVASAPQQNEQKVFLKMFKQSSKSNPPPKRYKKTKSKPPPQKNKLSFRRDSDQFR